MNTAKHDQTTCTASIQSDPLTQHHIHVNPTMWPLPFTDILPYSLPISIQTRQMLLISYHHHTFPHLFSQNISLSQILLLPDYEFPLFLLSVSLSYPNRNSNTLINHHFGSHTSCTCSPTIFMPIYLSFTHSNKASWIPCIF